MLLGKSTNRPVTIEVSRMFFVTEYVFKTVESSGQKLFPFWSDPFTNTKVRKAQLIES
jgi:hypothetical protein